MKILDKYITKKLLITFFFVVLTLITIICAIDYVEKNEDFIKHKLTFGFIFSNYYIYFIPYMANMISPLTVFIATVFVTARLASDTEIIAMLNSGMSFKRLLFPYFLSSCIIASGIFALCAWVIPLSNKKRIDFENKYIKNQFYYDARNVHIKIGPSSYVYLESYNNTSKTGYQFSLENIVDNKLVAKVKADLLTWNDTIQKWNLKNYTFRTFDGDKEIIKKGESLDTVIDLSPKDFESQYMIHETMTLPELNAHIDKLTLRGAENIELFLIEKYERYTYPFAIIILTIIGVIMSARKARGGAALQISLGFILAFVYILLVIMSRSVANAGSLSPLLGAWMPNILFAIVGAILYKTVPR
jgi:lipopolysaccharide export system permease protein